MKVKEIIEELKQFEQTLPVQFEYVDYNYDINVDNLSTNIVQEDNDLILVTTDFDNTGKQIRNVKDLLKTLKKFDKELNVMVKYNDFELGYMFINVDKVAKQTEFDVFNHKFEYCVLNKVI